MPPDPRNPADIPPGRNTSATTRDTAQQHVFFRGADGHIHHMVWNSFSGKVSSDDWTSRARAPLAAGDPAPLATAGQQHVFYRGTDGHIHHLLKTAGDPGVYHDVWTLRAGAPALGDPAALETDGQQHVFYRGTGGAVLHVLWDAASGLAHDDWTAKANAQGFPAHGDPIPLATPGQQHVFYRGPGGTVQHVLWNAGLGTFGHDDWSSAAHAAPMVGNPATLATEGKQHVFYRASDGSIQHIFWDAAASRLLSENWTALARAPVATGDPAAMTTPEGQIHVMYRGAAGTLVHIFSDPSSPRPRADDWTVPSQPLVAAGGRPATLLTRGQQHAFFTSMAGSIDHVFWDPTSSGLGRDDWTAKAHAPVAAGNPATLQMPAPPLWKILPLGDSITWGLYFPGGYRGVLFDLANAAGKHITFVGTQSDNPAIPGPIPFPPFHEGNSGKDIAFATGIVSRDLEFGPDIVLLMIGTNDILQNTDLAHAKDRLAVLLNRIIDADVCSLIVVAQVTPLPAFAAQVDTYNREIAELVPSLAAAGAPVLIADMHTGFSESWLNADRKHPEQPGYEHMAGVWFAAIAPFLT